MATARWSGRWPSVTGLSTPYTRTIEDLADREILLQQPAASDLRFLISVLRVVPELERSHDLIVDIARRGSLILS